jgi:hypothetical protein
MRNYVETSNPFKLAQPPTWFLTRLYAYDALLVIFPSTHEGLYRIGRRGRNGYGLLHALANKPDSGIYVRHHLWPWKSILPAAVGLDWNRVLLELPSYDTQRFDDAGAALDALEERQELSDKRTLANTLDAMGSESYKAMKLITGQRVGAGVRPEGAGFRKLPGRRKPRTTRSSSYRPLGAGPGGMFVGRE